MLTDEMQKLIRDHSAGMVATVNEDGTPAVSPKATFSVLAADRLVFGNIRSPNTLANLRARPAVEVVFIDVVTRKAVRVKGTGHAVRKEDADEVMRAAFAEGWGPYHEHISPYVEIRVAAAELILSPAYDLGLTEDELKRTNLEKLNAL